MAKSESLVSRGIMIRIARSARRKTVLLRVGKDGVPEILSPVGVPVRELQRIADENSAKLCEFLENYREREAAKAEFTPDYGSRLRFLGRTVVVTAREGNTVGYDAENFYIPPGLPPERIRAAVVQIYKLAARNEITPRVVRFAAVMRLSPMSVKINEARSHWASCSARDTLNFAWFLIMAAPEAIDYVVIHELCHMIEFNHSERFWKIVGEYCPDYASKKEYLKELWQEILKEGW